MARDWASYGIAWETETVSKGAAEFNAEIPTVVDLQKFVATLKAGGGDIVGLLNMSNSIRVASQDVNRNNADLGPELRRERIWSRLVGIRNAPRGTVTKLVISLPNGTKYEGTSWTECVAAGMAACIDLGMTAEMARTVAENIANGAGLKTEA